MGKKIRLHTTYASDTGVSGGPGDEIVVEDDRADQIVDGGFAEYVDEDQAPRSSRGRGRSGRSKTTAKQASEPPPSDPAGQASNPAG